MRTLDELLYYCEEPEPVGAVLLTGEWGCGKTYLVDNELKEELRERAHIIRVSLFGMTTIDAIHIAVKQAWVNEYTKDKKVMGVAEKMQQGREVVAKLDFLPEWVRGVATTDWQSFIKIKNKIDEKPVILIFDDLERCCLDNVDVLGAINEYCENQKFHTIIVANQDKMKVTSEIENLPLEAEIESFENGNRDEPSNKTVATIKLQKKKGSDELSYNEIKEKIIHRTVQYLPDYTSIVHTVVEKMQYQDDAYKEFVKNCEEGILELFAPERDVYSESQESKRPHNIRSLKCAIRDFYRIYELLKGNGFEDIEKWFFSFVSYVIAYKANIAKEGRYGTLLSDQTVKELYPAFQNQYMLTTVKKWILHGIWDDDAVIYELGTVQERAKAETPVDIVRTNRIMDVDEDIIHEGFPAVVKMAYVGELSLDEYVCFIKNSCWGRRYNFEFPIIINWSKVREGVNKSIEKLLDSRKEGRQLHSTISADNKEYFTEDEWNTYQIIEEFRSGNLLMFSNNRKTYIEEMQGDVVSAFVNCQNKRFNIFDEEMAIITTQAYTEIGNFEKSQFIGSFKDMWERNVISQDMQVEESLAGFCKLRELLNEIKKDWEKEGKAFAVCHTDDFVKNIEALETKLRDNAMSTE